MTGVQTCALPIWLTGAALTGILAVVLLFVVAIPAFGVHLYAATLPAAIVTLVLGGIALSGLGLAVATLARTADQAMPLAQLTFLPLSFISGVFYPLQGAPDWLVKLANVFPLHHLVVAFDGALQPNAPHHGWSTDLWPLLAWTAVALFVAVRRFSREATS